MDPLLIAATALLLLAAAAVYAGLCWAIPFGRCRPCGGAGERTTLLLRRPVNCTRCGGTGRRVRLGRRLHTRASKAHDTAAPAARG